MSVGLEGEPIDRATVNAWEDNDSRAAVEQTGRRKLVIAALWTEVCLCFPTLDALRDGYEVYPIIDAVEGTSSEAHDLATRRMAQVQLGSAHLRTAARLAAQGHRGRVRQHLLCGQLRCRNS